MADFPYGLQWLVSRDCWRCGGSLSFRMYETIPKRGRDNQE